MKKNKKTNKKANKKTIGLVLLIIGIIGFFGAFGDNGFSVDTALGSTLFIAIGIFLFAYKKKTKINNQPDNRTATKTSHQEPKTEVIPDGEKDYNLIPNYANGQFLVYEYEENICFIKEDNIDEKFGYVIGNGGKQLLFEFEPENQYDCMAIAIYLNDKKLGYVYSGRIQEMMHDYYHKGWEICAHINKYSTENKTATYKVGFFKPMECFKSKQFSLVKTTKKISEYSNRADNLYWCKEGDVLTIECEGIEEEKYVVYADGCREIGELPSSANNFIEVYNPQRIMGILNSCEEDENGKLNAIITVYLI